MDEQLKVKRKSLSLTEKLNVLRKCDTENVISKAVFAKSVCIDESTLRALLKKRQKLVNSASAGGSGKKKIKVTKFEELEKILFEWFAQTRSTNIPTNGSLIKEKACEISTRLGVVFMPSNGWLDPVVEFIRFAPVR